jgi:hypothetical protein
VLGEPGIEAGEAIGIVGQLNGGFAAIAQQQARIESKLAHVDAQQGVVGELRIHANGVRVGFWF